MKRLISIALVMLFIITSISCLGITASAEEVAAPGLGVLEQLSELPAAVVYIIIAVAVMAAIWLVIFVIWLLTLPFRLIAKARREKVKYPFLRDAKEMFDSFSAEDKKRLAIICGGISLVSILLGATLFRRRY